MICGVLCQGNYIGDIFYLLAKCKMLFMSGNLQIRSV